MPVTLTIFDKVRTPHGTGMITACNYDKKIYDVALDCIMDEAGNHKYTEDGRVRILDGFELEYSTQTYPERMIQKL